MNNDAQHDHLKDEPAQAATTIELFTALPPIMGLEELRDTLYAEFPFHPSSESVQEHLSDEGRTMPLRIVKVTIEYTGERIGELPDGN